MKSFLLTCLLMGAMLQPLGASPLDRLQAVTGSPMAPLFRSPVPVANIPLILPLEADLGRSTLRPGGSPLRVSNERATSSAYLRSEGFLSLNPNADSGSMYLQFRENRINPSLDLDYFDPARAWLDPNAGLRELDLTLLYKASRFSLLFDVAHSQKAGLELNDPEENLAAGLSLGYGIGHNSPVSVLLGLYSRHRITDPFRENQIIGAEYGTLFFTPGLQITTAALTLEATVEVPVHTYDLRPESDTSTPTESDLRARFGIKYYLP
ncbi:MAG: hypothetical protein KDK37_03545 [Leptospiraceae bacterium]|nr:hypothetical protein [Leptospiraceae bacterium]MCB1303318.1 hypothetical protein [Leptospiraceae bacterium]